MTMFLNFSVMPLRLSTILGISMAGFGLLGFFSVVIEALHGRTPEGWASLMVVTLLLSGVQLIILGVSANISAGCSSRSTIGRNS